MSEQSARDEVFDAIKRAFLALDDEILAQARNSGCADCQFGGTTALMALRIGHVRCHLLDLSTFPPWRQQPNFGSAGPHIRAKLGAFGSLHLRMLP